MILQLQRAKIILGLTDVAISRYLPGELAAAGHCYAAVATGDPITTPWPWGDAEWQPHTVGADLIRAGAYWLAVIERFEMATEAGPETDAQLARAREALAVVITDLEYEAAWGDPRASTAGIPPPRHVEAPLRYAMVVTWCEELDRFLVGVPEWPGCGASGATYEEAVQAAQDELHHWIRTTWQMGREVPRPHALALA